MPLSTAATAGPTEARSRVPAWTWAPKWAPLGGASGAWRMFTAFTENDHSAGVGSVLPAGSSARTEKVWFPLVRLCWVHGEAQSNHVAASSSRQVKLEPPSVAVKRKSALSTSRVPVGPLWIAVSGGVVSVPEVDVKVTTSCGRLEAASLEEMSVPSLALVARLKLYTWLGPTAADTSHSTHVLADTAPLSSRGSLVRGARLDQSMPPSVHPVSVRYTAGPLGDPLVTKARRTALLTGPVIPSTENLR